MEEDKHKRERVVENMISEEERSAKVRKDNEDNHNEDDVNEANDIASKLMSFLREGFIKREDREPSDNEMCDLLSEMTEDRIMELMGGEDEEHQTKEEKQETKIEEETPKEDLLGKENEGEYENENTGEIEKEIELKFGSSLDELTKDEIFETRLDHSVELIKDRDFLAALASANKMKKSTLIYALKGATGAVPKEIEPYITRTDLTILLP